MIPICNDDKHERDLNHSIAKDWGSQPIEGVNVETGNTLFCDNLLEGKLVPQEILSEKLND